MLALLPATNLQLLRALQMDDPADAAGLWLLLQAMAGAGLIRRAGPLWLRV